MEKKAIKKMFPHLYEELESGDVKVQINGIRKNACDSEGEVDECNSDENQELLDCNEMPDTLRHFNPQAVDFLRRCETEEQAEEIIAYLEKKGEISKEYASELRCQLKKDGVRSFGTKKEENHYFKEAGIY
jgi:hypothetical protein